ncbi:MAG: DUF2156 domain-containing protein, partial [Thermomicrobiaceae bacterium]|nr:DUF2156 domain-containing protein [Thermomicrobiaceae bacterium]
TLPDVDGAIRYRRLARVRIVAGDPLARAEDQPVLLRAFLAEARRAGDRVLLLPATARLRRLVEAAGLGGGAIKIGEEAYYHLPTWSLRGSALKHVRNQVNRTARLGMTAERLDPRRASAEDLARIERIIRDWYATRGLPPLGFLMGLDPVDHAEMKRCFVARHAGRIVGYVSCHPMPDRNAWYLAELLRAPDAPEGTTELLVKTAFEALRDEGAEWATFGLAPLANVLEDDRPDHRRFRRLLDLIYRRADRFYRFRSLHFFKRKFQPAEVEPVYALLWPDRLTPRIPWALARALAPLRLPGRSGRATR